MTGSETAAQIEPIRLGPQSKFVFRCHPGVSCFTQCCRGINIILTPYDIIRLKHRLQLSSEQFLAMYTEPQLLEKTDLPVVTLKMVADETTDSEQKTCAFVRPNGCVVYPDRPTACRYYPLGMATLSYKESADDQGFYFFVNEPHCLGFKEEKVWTVAEWRHDQGVDVYDRVNREWTELVIRKRSFSPAMKLTAQSKRMFFLVSYNLDQFREFVFQSTFLKRYDVDAETVERIRQDDLALLDFGLKWLKWAFFKLGDVKFRSRPSP
jgi:uncharacterized protein